MVVGDGTPNQSSASDISRDKDVGSVTKVGGGTWIEGQLGRVS